MFTQLGTMKLFGSWGNLDTATGTFSLMGWVNPDGVVIKETLHVMADARESATKDKPAKKWKPTKLKVSIYQIERSMGKSRLQGRNDQITLDRDKFELFTFWKRNSRQRHIECLRLRVKK